MVVVLLEARFFVLDVPVVNFFGAAFTTVPVDFAVPVDFETVLLTVFAGILVVVRTALPALREAVVVDRLAALRPEVPVEARATIRGAGFFLGVVARTSRIALVCSSSVIRNSWCPSRVATKYRYGTFAGFAAAARLATPGDATGPGGRPLCRYVL